MGEKEKKIVNKIDTGTINKLNVFVDKTRETIKTTTTPTPTKTKCIRIYKVSILYQPWIGQSYWLN